MYICLNVNNRYSCTSLTELEFSRQFFENYLNIKFRDNTFSIRDVTCGQTLKKLRDFFTVLRTRLKRPLQHCRTLTVLTL